MQFTSKTPLRSFKALRKHCDVIFAWHVIAFHIWDITLRHSVPSAAQKDSKEDFRPSSCHLCILQFLASFTPSPVHCFFVDGSGSAESEVFFDDKATRISSLLGSGLGWMDAGYWWLRFSESGFLDETLFSWDYGTVFPHSQARSPIYNAPGCTTIPTWL